MPPNFYSITYQIQKEKTETPSIGTVITETKTPREYKVREDECLKKHF